jgi:hypothetical protein
MGQGQLNWIANFIWGIADDVLRDLYVRGKYRDVILPMTVLRRLDAVLEPTKQAVLDMKASLDKAGIANQDQALRQAAGQAFYNTSNFTLRDLKARTSQQQLKADFEAYLDGFSPNVQDILDNFEFRNQIPRLSKADALGTLIEKFLSSDIDLSPRGLDNHGMGTVFEELVRRFNEENNEEAGEHWTPRDAVKMMAKLILLPVADELESGTYLLYDGACGTGGMLTVAEDTLQQIAAEHGKQVATHLYGQEINAETYAICKADLLVKGEGDAADNIVGGPEHSTLANDALPRGAAAIHKTVRGQVRIAAGSVAPSGTPHQPFTIPLRNSADARSASKRRLSGRFMASTLRRDLLHEVEAERTCRAHQLAQVLVGPRLVVGPAQPQDVFRGRGVIEPERLARPARHDGDGGGRRELPPPGAASEVHIDVHAPAAVTVDVAMPVQRQPLERQVRVDGVMFVGPVLHVGRRVKRVLTLADENQDVVLVLLQDPGANECVVQPIARRRVDDLRPRARGVDKELKLGIRHETLLSQAAFARHLPLGRGSAIVARCPEGQR